MKIRFGYTPDTDDAFHYYALEKGKVVDGRAAHFEFLHQHIQELNDMALAGELEVSAVSSIVYPQIAERYAILSAGSSVGRGYGPVLGVKAGSGLKDLRNKTVGVPGKYTTGYFLVNYFYEGFRPVFLPHDQIVGAITRGEVDAGVLIHEELLNYKFRGVERLSCLGEQWFSETGLPLPVGLTVARRNLGAETIAWLRGLLEKSMCYALEHPGEAMAFARSFSTGREDVTRDFVSKFANDDTVRMPDDVRRGLKELFSRAFRRGLIPSEPTLEIL